jgi:signal recognition particle GTPase
VTKRTNDRERSNNCGRDKVTQGKIKKMLKEHVMKKPLKQITIKGFKSIRELESFPLSSLNILIGANGSGKTNFISAFRLLNQIVEEIYNCLLVNID